MRQTLTIKLKPHLQEFLICKLADEASEASKKNLIGAILSPLIDYAPKDYVFEKLSGKEYITFELPDRLGGKDTRQRAVVISNKNQREFERILGIYFMDIFFQYVDDKIRYTSEIKKCIMQFCADYNISYNHINYERLKKAYYRRQKAQNRKNNFAVNLSLTSPLIFLL